MKWSTLLYLAPAVTAFVVPDQQVFQELQNEDKTLLDGVKDGFDGFAHNLQNQASAAKNKAQSVLDDALEWYSAGTRALTDEAWDARSWLDEKLDHLYDAEEEGLLGEADTYLAADHGDDKEHEKPPHHDKPPHRGKPPHHGKPHKGHGRPSHHSNLTVYQLIAESKYTTKLAAILEDYPDLVETLNSTKANYTVFVPVDSAFEKIPEHAPKPSKEQLERLLTYHVAPGVYPALRVLSTHTIPTLLETDELSDKTKPQRLSVHLGLKGLTLNFYSRVIGVNFFAKNGVIHAVDSLLLPPPSVLKIIDLLPTEFSTLELGLTKTGLLEELDEPHKGGTFFAPSNFAFAQLGPRINAFLFSKYGEKYLKALLKYHVVPKTTLYSDHIYTDESDDESAMLTGRPKKGYYHLDLPTLLEGDSLSVDIVRYGGFISIKVNGFVRVVTQDGIAKDGVVQVVGNVLIPPKKGGKGAWEAAYYSGEMDLDDFKDRLEPYLE